MSATIDPNMINDEDRLRGVFNIFDTDNTNKITIENMIKTFSKFGRDITDEEIKHALEQHDKSNEDAISFDEFKAMMLDWIHKK